jgi:hypothetical protein
MCQILIRLGAREQKKNKPASKSARAMLNYYVALALHSSSTYENSKQQLARVYHLRIKLHPNQPKSYALRVSDSDAHVQAFHSINQVLNIANV